MALSDSKDNPTLRRRLAEGLSSFRNMPQALLLVWKAHPAGVAVLPILTLLGAPLPAITLYATKKVIDGLTLWIQGDPVAGQRVAVTWIAVGLGLTLLGRGLDLANSLIQDLVRIRLQHHIQATVMRKAAVLDMAFFETPSFYDKLQRAQRESAYRPYTILSSTLAMGGQVLQLASYIAVLATLSWLALPFLVLITLPGLFVQVRFGRKGWSLMMGRTPDERRMRYYERQMCEDREAKEMRLFRLAPHFIGMWEELFWKIYRQDRRLTISRRLWEMGTMMFRAAGASALVLYAVYRAAQDPLVTIGSVVMYTQALDRAVGSVENIFRTISTIYENNLYVGTLFEFLAQEPRIRAPLAPAAVPVPIRGGITFEGVSFRYPGQERLALDDISFTIRPCERVAIVGENGAGKTTLVKLLARLYDPQAGRILVDGADLREFDPEHWHRQIGVIFQDFSRFHLTARENVGLGQLEYLNDRTRLDAAAERSGADECIRRLPRGWENVLGKWFDEGQELSGGEWQKIALARAFLRDSQVLILDEPTAALDAKQECEVFRRFNELTQGKTTILISHRFSTVRMADRIFVINEGRLTECGSHSDLMTLNGIYADLFNRQAEAYRM